MISNEIRGVIEAAFPTTELVFIVSLNDSAREVPANVGPDEYRARQESLYRQRLWPLLNRLKSVQHIEIDKEFPIFNKAVLSGPANAWREILRMPDGVLSRQDLTVSEDRMVSGY